jgi:hypothetical protein
MPRHELTHRHKRWAQQVFVLTAFRNDVYRSMGGFARVFDVLKRGKELDDRLFFGARDACACACARDAHLCC